MKQFYRLHLSIMITCLLVSGCVGSKIRIKEADLTEPFPSLHSVPERPLEEERQPHESGQTVDEIVSQDAPKESQGREEKSAIIVKQLQQNQDLRKQFGL